MTKLFTDAGRQRLMEFARPGLLCAFDFDGTLAPIVPTPGDARLPEAIRDRLLALAAHAPVAIITGRSIEDIRGRLDFDPEYLIGNHGMEGVPGWEDEAARHRELCAGWQEQLRTALASAYPDPGVQLEDKRYSLSVHYRFAHDPARAAEALARLFEGLSPRPRVVGGKFVFNLLAGDACNKGSALERLMQVSNARHAIYVGDDVTDEDVFRLRRSDVLSVRVEPHADSAADFYLDRYEEIGQFLEELTQALQAGGARARRA